MRAFPQAIEAGALLLFASISLGAWAAPTVRVMERGGAVQVFATNPDERSYNCTLAMAWSHASFGVRRDVVVKQPAQLGARTADALIYSGGVGSFDLQVDSAPTLSCH